MGYLVHQLHGKGMVCGNAKPGNVLTGTNGDVRMVDFGGGRTDGRVDREVRSRNDGDLQALKVIRHFLGGEAIHIS